MLLVFDIGNTNITFGIFDKYRKLITKESISTSINKPADIYAVDFVELFISKKINCTNIGSVIIGSVVPTLNPVIKEAVEKFVSSSTKINIIGEDNIKININNKTIHKKEVGHDRLLNAVAAHQKFNDNLIIIDFGTAVTFDVVTREGDYLGGAIFPGINISLKTLHESTSKLPLIEYSKPSRVIGRSTKEAILSGIYSGYESLISGMISKIEAEYSFPMKKIFTGGQAQFFKKLIKELNGHLEEDLTINGLKIIHEYNHKNES